MELAAAGAAGGRAPARPAKGTCRGGLYSAAVYCIFVCSARARVPHAYPLLRIGGGGIWRPLDCSDGSDGADDESPARERG